MSRHLFLSLLLCAAPALQAQEPHVGLSFGLLLPNGQFRTHSFGPTLQVPDAIQTEGYDVGAGGQLTLSFPVERHWGIRLNLAGYQTQGSNTAPGYSAVNLRHALFAIGGELQYFTVSAYRHRGLYFFGGLHAHFERFDASEGEIDYDDTSSFRRSKGAFSAGVGHTFGLDAGFRLTLEAAYRRALDTEARGNERPPTEFTTLSLGFTF